MILCHRELYRITFWRAIIAQLWLDKNYLTCSKLCALTFMGLILKLTFVIWHLLIDICYFWWESKSDNVKFLTRLQLEHILFHLVLIVYIIVASRISFPLSDNVLVFSHFFPSWWKIQWIVRVAHTPHTESVSRTSPVKQSFISRKKLVQS